MYYVIGLHNPEEKYQDTPHNIGGQILNMIYEKHDDLFTTRREERKIKADIVDTYIADHDVQFIFPREFMNNSGRCVSHVDRAQREKVIVVHDDIDLPFEQIRIAFNRGDGGHNGIKDIVRQLGGKDFIRIRIGVQPLDWFGNPRKPKGGKAVNNYLVYKKLSKKYMMQYPEIADKVWGSLQMIVEEGREKAMNKFN